jgi:ATP-dependent DNA ligase
MGLERIASKRMDSHDRSGRSPDWIKSKYPNYALQKLSEAVDALATGAGRVQDWLGVNRRSVCLQ